MLSKSLSFVPIARKAFLLNAPIASKAQGIVRYDHHGPPANYKYPTMDDMLVPCGSWQENYDNNQRKYNIHLLLGSGFFIITMAVGYYSGSFNIYLLPPDKPSPPNVPIM